MITKVSQDKEYAYVQVTVNSASAWKKSEQWEVNFLDIRGSVQVVTLKSVSDPLLNMIVEVDKVSA